MQTKIKENLVIVFFGLAIVVGSFFLLKNGKDFFVSVNEGGAGKQIGENTELAENKQNPIKLDVPATAKLTYTATQNPDQSTDITLASQDFFKLNLPQNLSQPVSVLLSNSRTIALSQQGENNLQAIEKTQIKTTPENEKLLAIIQKDPSLKIYQNENQTTFYTAQESKNENQQWLLKNWTLYSAPPSQEAQPALGGLASNSEITQAFKIQNAAVNLDSSGNANVFFGTAQAKNQNPDFVIPRPYLLDKNAVRKDLDWKFEKTTSLLSVTFAMPQESFPIALDPSILKTNKVVATFSGKAVNMHYVAPACNAIIPGQTCTFGGITYSVGQWS